MVKKKQANEDDNKYKFFIWKYSKIPLGNLAFARQ